MRWVLLAGGIAAIIGFAATTEDATQPRRPIRPITVPLDPDSVEPAPLVFQPNIAPETAETINAERPDFAGAIVAARPFIANRSAERLADLKRATECLSQAVYYEAASESPEGQRAVAQVVLNRVRDPRYPGSVCGVVFQGSERRTGCQFTFTCDGSMARQPEPVLFLRARIVALGALAGRVEQLVGLATHYHTKQVVPYWRTDLVKLRTVGAHIFYGWQGRERSGRGLRTGYAGIEPVINPAAIDPLLVLETLPVVDELLGNSTDPFAAPASPPGLAAPKIRSSDFGQMRADQNAGQLSVGAPGDLKIDNQSGVLKKP